MMALSKLAVERLTKLADFMDALPAAAAGHFTMRSWMRHDGLHDFAPEVITEAALMDCGTTACAAGWACSVPEFRAAGFGMERRVVEGRTYWIPKFGEDKDDDAVMSFFDLDGWDTNDYLFHSYDIASPHEWAEHCRQFIRDSAPSLPNARPRSPSKHRVKVITNRVINGKEA